jgi:hypothetical protein
MTSTISTILNNREREENQARTVVPFSSLPIHLSCSPQLQSPITVPSLSLSLALPWQLHGSYMVLHDVMAREALPLLPLPFSILPVARAPPWRLLPPHTSKLPSASAAAAAPAVAVRQQQHARSCVTHTNQSAFLFPTHQPFQMITILSPAEMLASYAEQAL